MGAASFAAPGRAPDWTEPVTGRGVSIMVRQNSYWMGIAEVKVTPARELCRSQSSRSALMLER